MVSSVSNFHLDTGGRRWSLVQVRLCSRAVGRGGTADKYHWPVWGAPAVFWPHWVCPCSGQTCVLSPSTLLRLPPALYGAGPVLPVVPVFGYSTKARTRLGLCFVPSPTLAAQATRSLRSALSLGAAHLLPSTVPASVSARTSRVHAPCVCSLELASGRDPPGECRPSIILGSLWLETGSLFAVW